MRLLFAVALSFSTLHPINASAFLYELSGGDRAVDDITYALRSTLERAHVLGSGLIGELDDAATDRLSQLEEIVDQTLTRVEGAAGEVTAELERVANKTLDRALELEAQVIQDLKNLADCTIENAGEEVSEIIFDAFDQILAREPRIDIGPFSGALVVNDRKRFEPNEVWILYMKAAMEELRLFEGDDLTRDLAFLYDNIERQSRLVRCFYKDDSATFVLATREMLEAQRRSRNLVPFL